MSEIKLNLKLPTKPCPFCGNIKLYQGRLSASSFGVQCYECGARLELHVPHEYPKGIESFEELFIYTYEKSIENWNRRIVVKNGNKMINIKISSNKIFLYESYCEHGSTLTDIIEIFSSLEEVDKFIAKLEAAKTEAFKENAL